MSRDDLSFFWHDYETFGRVPRRDRPAQFAGVRTDEALNEIDAPVMLYCKPAPDYLPEPEACLLTGIVPQTCLERGVPEHAFADAIEAQLARPGTVGVGYNSIRFDDEVTRFLFWRNLLDPYAREWQNGCGRWDLLDVLRCAHALRPDGIVWPQVDGRTSFRLEELTRANGIEHAAAHDALADVRATIAMARLLRRHQPRLWDFCLKLRRKDAVAKEMQSAQSQGLPFLHVSGRYGVERGCIAVVWPLAPHPTNKNEVIVWDLAQDPRELLPLSAAQVRERLFVSEAELPEGTRRLPIKTIHLNRAPIVIGNLKTLPAPMAARWGLDIDAALRHAEHAAKATGALAGLWPDVFERPAGREAPVDVDEALYDGFLANEDRRRLSQLRTLSPQALAERHPAFADPRLDELVFRFRARNFPETLDEDEQARWLEHRAGLLLEGAGGGPTLQAYLERLDLLGEEADERGQEILGALVDYATEIAPETA